MFSKEEVLISKEGLEKLNNAKVTIVGVGGVGGFTVELLARAGVGNITIIDGDRVEKSNINRQVVATIESVGHFKAEEMANRLTSINPQINVNAINKFLDKDNLDLIEQDNYVIDCIDDIDNKVRLIKYCSDNNIKILTALGAGNRIDIPSFKVVDVYKSTDDGLAKVLRKKLKELNIEKLTCVASATKPIKVTGTTIGSISYYPNAMSCVLAAKVINDLLEGK